MLIIEYLLSFNRKETSKNTFFIRVVAQGMNYLLTSTGESDTVGFWQEVG